MAYLGRLLADQDAAPVRQVAADGELVERAAGGEAPSRLRYAEGDALILRPC